VSDRTTDRTPLETVLPGRLLSSPRRTSVMQRKTCVRFKGFAEKLMPVCTPKTAPLFPISEVGMRVQAKTFPFMKRSLSGRRHGGELASAMHAVVVVDPGRSCACPGLSSCSPSPRRYGGHVRLPQSLILRRQQKGALSPVVFLRAVRDNRPPPMEAGLNGRQPA
jgi:hypothetical protein